MAELVLNGNMGSPALAVTTRTQASLPTSWTVLSSQIVLVNFNYQVGGVYQYPRDIVPSSINQWYDIVSTTSTNSYLYQDIIFPNAGNYVLSYYINANSTSVLPLVVNIGSNTLITTSSLPTYTIDKWYNFTLPFSITTPTTQRLTFTVNKSNNFELGVTGVSIMAAHPPCFREGTLISCSLNGLETEVPIENLKEFPYLVKTLKHGFLPIHSIGKSLLHNPGNKDRIKRRLYKLSPLNYPEIYTPLYLTGCHGLLVPSLSDKEIQACQEQYEGKLFVTDGHYRLFACLDERAEPFDTEGEFPIYHVALQSEDKLVNYGIYANGLLVESCSIWSLTEKHKQVELMVTGK